MSVWWALTTIRVEWLSESFRMRLKASMKDDAGPESIQAAFTGSAMTQSIGAE